MTTKLTLRIDSKVIDEAMSYAKEKGISLPKLIENLLKDTCHSTNIKKGSATELVGIIGKAPRNFNYKKELYKILEEKYLK